MDARQQQRGQPAGSRWGVKGTEDLGGGPKALFQLENGFDPSNGRMVGRPPVRPAGVRRPDERPLRHAHVRPPVRSARRSRAGHHRRQLSGQRVRDGGRRRQLRQQLPRRQRGEVHVGRLFGFAVLGDVLVRRHRRQHRRREFVFGRRVVQQRAVQRRGRLLPRPTAPRRTRSAPAGPARRTARSTARSTAAMQARIRSASRASRASTSPARSRSASATATRSTAAMAARCSARTSTTTPGKAS